MKMWSCLMKLFQEKTKRLMPDNQKMGLRTAVLRSFKLLSKSQQKKYKFCLVRQACVSTLDLFAVATLGVASALISSQQLHGTGVGRALEFFGLNTQKIGSTIGWLVGCAVLLFLLKGLFALINLYATLTFLNKTAVIQSRQLLAEMYRCPITLTNKQPTQDLAYSLSPSVNAAYSDILGNATVFVGEVVLVTILALGMLVTYPTLATVALVYFGAVALIMNKLLGSRAVVASRMRANSEVAGNAFVVESVTTFREVLVAGKNKFYMGKFEAARLESSLANRTAQFIAAVPKYAYELALIVGTAITGVIAYATYTPSEAATITAVFLATGSRAMPSLLRLQGAINGIQNGIGVSKHFFDVKADITDHQIKVGSNQLNAESSDIFVPSVTVSNAFYAYNEDSSYTINDVSLTIPAGEAVALVGPSGAGKSTLADLILGAIVPISGKVLISGLPPRDSVLKWPGKIAYVPQTVGISHGTVRENVALGFDTDLVDDEMVWSVLELVKLKDLFQSNGQGLNSEVGERGSLLSGGQRQRLGLARALYTRPELLILDEATSALDAETEHIITQTLKTLSGSVTTITIAHRLATVLNSDSVIYMEAGRVVAQGTFQEVRNQVPRFNDQANILGLNPQT